MNWEFTIADLVGWLLALTAGGWSLYTWRKGNETARLQTQMQQHLAEIEEAREKDRLQEKRKADLTARIDTKVTRYPQGAGAGDRLSTNHRLVVENHGAAEGRSIEILLDGQPLAEHPVFPTGQQVKTQIGPRSSFTYLLAIAFGRAGPFDLVMTWTDDSGEPGEFKTPLSIT